MTFAEVMFKAMEERGMNAKQLADASGVSQQYISKLKTAWVKDPTFDKAVAIIRALNMDIDEFARLTMKDE